MFCYLTKETTVCCGGKYFFLYFHFPEKKIDKIKLFSYLLYYYNVRSLFSFVMVKYNRSHMAYIFRITK